MIQQKSANRLVNCWTKFLVRIMLRRKAALIIGIDYVGKSSLELAGCVNDAVNVREMLIEEMEYPADSIEMLVDRNVEGGTNIPTKANIIAGLAKLVDLAKLGYTEVWIHYSGHGYYQHDYGGDEKDFYDEVLVPTDYQRAGFISDDLMYRTFCTRLPASCKAVTVFDCCHSGTMMDLRYKYRHEVSQKYLIENDRVTNNNIICLSGCKDEEQSQEASYFERQEQRGGNIKVSGAMTLSLLTTLEKYNYTITGDALIRHIRSQLSSWGFSQRPQLTTSFEIKDNTLLFQRVKKPHVSGFAVSWE